MSQYRQGTASVTQSSQTVTGTGTAWLANVTPGDGFTVAGTGVPYTVASVETDTSLTLSAPYAGATASGQVYTVWRDFTTNYSIPELSQGDIETATIWTRAARIIDGSMAKVDNIALQGTVGVYGSTANGLAGTTAGDYFFVVDTANLVLYLNDAGAATLVGTYPLLEDIQADFDASLVELQAQQDAFQANHVRLSRSLSKSPDNGETLRLDFATNGYGIGSDLSGMDQAASILDLVTFTRASEATYYDAQGILRTAAMDEPRLTYDPETGESLGLLIEEQRTNLTTNSENASGTSSGGGRAITRNVPELLAPDGSQTVDKFEATFGNTTISSDVITLSSGSTYTFTAWLARPPGELIEILLQGPAGITVLENTSNVAVNELELRRYTVTVRCDSTGDIQFAPLVRSSDTNKILYFWGLQVEQGSYPTSYIKTEASQATRDVDNSLRVLAQEFNADEGALYVEADARSGETLLTLGAQSIVADVDGLKKYAITYDTELSASDIVFGTGTFRDVRYIPRALTATELEALTS